MIKNPFEEDDIELTKVGKEFKGVTDLLLSLEGKISNVWLDLLLNHTFEHYSGTERNTFEIMHEKIWYRDPLIDMIEGEEEPDDNPLNNIPDEIEEEEVPEIRLPNPFDMIDALNKSLNKSNNKNIKKVKATLDKERKSP